MKLPWLKPEDPFPPTDAALAGEWPGLLAAGGDLSPERLLAAYARGIFPWYSAGEPILWWTMDPRMVLQVSEFVLHASLARAIRRWLARPGLAITFDAATPAVIAACASAPRSGQRGTWITPEMQAAYGRLHALGHAHSAELWRDGRLVGGIYGVLLGRVFFGESMFSAEPDASKIALAAVVAFARASGIPLIDCQQETPHLASLGARPISRRAFEAQLRTLALPEFTPQWAYDPANWALLGIASPPASA